MDHGKNAINLATATTSQVVAQATITSKLIRERYHRDNLDKMEELHRAESSGARDQQLEQEQNQQEQEDQQERQSDQDILDEKRMIYWAILQMKCLGKLSNQP